jgi:hypothetical protein
MEGGGNMSEKVLVNIFFEFVNGKTQNFSVNEKELAEMEEASRDTNWLKLGDMVINLDNVLYYKLDFIEDEKDIPLKTL